MTTKTNDPARVYRGRFHYEDDPETFNAEAYRVPRWKIAVAVSVLGWETEADEDTEWTGLYVRTGRVSVVMVGDDAVHNVDPEDLEPIADEDYCGGCGQIGCGHSLKGE